MVLSFAVLLDPRSKLDFVTYSLKKLHGGEIGVRLANEVYLKFVELFKYYDKNSRDGGSCDSAAVDVEQNSSSNDLEEFFACHGVGRNIGMVEYDAYFKVPKEDPTPDFDVLTYWSKNTKSYPIISSMAKDILAIPITTVASESTFSMGGRILNKWRSSLLSKHVEALVTIRDWLFGYEELEDGVDVDGSRLSDGET